MIARASPLLFVFAFAGGCRDEPLDRLPQGMPEEYARNAFVQACGQHMKSVSNLRGTLFRDAQHGDAVFNVLPDSSNGAAFKPSEIEIANGEPTRQIAQLHLGAPTLGITAEVTFDGWVISRQDCPDMLHDIYFVDRFTEARLLREH